MTISIRKIIPVFMLMPFFVPAQDIKEKLILSDTKDSLYLNASSTRFDKDGNYCFKSGERGKEYFYTSRGNYGPFESIGGTYGGNGSVEYTYAYSDKEGADWYYRNPEGTKVYGPVKGKMEEAIDGGTKENIGITVTYKDSVYYYANNKLVASMDKKNARSFSSDLWCAFSENGNLIYSTGKDNLFSVFVNGKLIDTSTSNYYQLGINDAGQYIFGEGRKPLTKGGKYDFMFFTHSVDTMLGPVRTVWKHDIKEDGGYYYNGDDNGSDYIVINNKLYKNIDGISNITLLDKSNFLFTCNAVDKPEDQRQVIMVNGKPFTYSYEKIFDPALDNKGNFAFYGLKNYYLYKYVNGKAIPDPITKYGVRPVPLYISPQGNSLHYFKTDDSTYVYRDDKLLFPAFSNATNFEMSEYSDILPHIYSKEKAGNGKNLFYMEIDSSAYFVYNGEISRPMKSARGNFYHKDIGGEIVAGGFNDHGFFAIQKTGKDKYLLNINNAFYKELEGMSILKDNCFFDGKQLVFYGVKGLSFYQYILTL